MGVFNRGLPGFVASLPACSFESCADSSMAAAVEASHVFKPYKADYGEAIEAVPLRTAGSTK